jgi:ATP-binding cassette subfamily C protein CydC
VLQHLRIYTFSKLLPLSLPGWRVFVRVSCLTVSLRMSTRWITLPARDFPDCRRVCGDCGGHAGLSVLDVSVALTLGGIMLLTLIILPPLSTAPGNPGENLTRLRGDYRQQLTSWLQGQAELTISVQASAIARMESTELNWHEAQRRQSELTAFPRH